MKLYLALMLVLGTAILWANSRPHTSLNRNQHPKEHFQGNWKKMNFHQSSQARRRRYSDSIEKIDSTTELPSATTKGSVTNDSPNCNISLIDCTRTIAKTRLEGNYKVWTGRHCGGKSITQWLDGSMSLYGGLLSRVSACKEICNLHKECKAFVHRETDSKCSFWKRGILTPTIKKDRNCYEKQEGCTCNDFVNDFGFGACNQRGRWSPRSYEPGYFNTMRGVFKDSYFCFVNQASTCPDLLHSMAKPEVGQKMSAEACKKDPNIFGFVRSNKGSHCQNRGIGILFSFIPDTLGNSDITTARSRCELYCHKNELC